MTRSIGAMLLALTLVTSVACGSKSNTEPTPVLVTENFTGTVQIGGSFSHPFTVITANSPASLILTAAGPPTTISMGLGIGGWNASTSTCTLLSGVSTPAGSTAQLTGYVQTGTYCAQVFDVGNASAQVTYAVTVLHY